MAYVSLAATKFPPSSGTNRYEAILSGTNRSDGLFVPQRRRRARNATESPAGLGLRHDSAAFQRGP